jgi:hypothetical protein
MSETPVLSAHDLVHEYAGERALDGLGGTSAGWCGKTPPEAGPPEVDQEDPSESKESGGGATASKKAWGPVKTEPDA